MSYIDDISEALVRVLTQASDGSPEKFAGYAANRNFWIAEAKHCLDVINGYGDRFERMKRASQASHPPKIIDWTIIPISEPSMKASDLTKQRSKVREATE